MTDKLTVVLENEKKIIQKIALGDKQAFSYVYETYYELLCMYAFRFFNDEEEATELVQTALVKVWDRREKLVEVKALKSYLYRMVHNMALNRIQHLKAAEKYKNAVSDELQSIEMEDVEFHEEDPQTAKLKDALAKLPPKNREVFELRFYGGLKHKEIAERLNITERTVETHITKGLKKLRELLKDFFKD